MNQATNRPLRSDRLRPMFGAYSRGGFLRRLNSPEIHGAAHHRKSENLLRIVELVGQINEMDLSAAANAPPLANSFTVDGREVVTFAETRLGELEAELNSRASRANLAILLTPKFRIRKGKLRCSLLPTTIPGGKTASTPDMFLLADLEEAAATGDLERVRRCAHCKKWFFRRGQNGRFCKAKCRKAGFESTEQYKAQRAEYMRVRRKDEKAGAKKALALARRKQK